MKLKLKPSAKIKRRYVLIEGSTKAEVEEILKEYIGVLGWTKTKPSFIEVAGKDIVLSVDRKQVDDIRAAIELSNSKAKILKISGTLKGLLG